MLLRSEGDCFWNEEVADISVLFGFKIKRNIEGEEVCILSCRAKEDPWPFKLALGLVKERKERRQVVDRGKTKVRLFEASRLSHTQSQDPIHIK